MKKVLKVFIYILCGAAAAVLIFTGYHIISLHGFYKTANQEFLMPGIEDRKFDEQGLDYDEDTGLIFFTGYMRDKSANPIYLVDPDTGDTVKAVRLLNADGSDFCGHAGGIAVTDEYIYIAGSGDCCLYVFDKAEVLQAENESSVTCIGAFPTAVSDENGVKVSFVANAGDTVYVGEFYYPLPFYRLRSSHRLNTQNGNNHALMIGFSIDPDEPLGLSAEPSIAYSLPDQVQGVCFYEDAIYLSRSFGLVPSVISKNEPVEEGTYEVLGTTVPLYSLRETSRLLAPPMSEEIDMCNGRLYIASELYNIMVKGFGRPWGAEYCWSIAE